MADRVREQLLGYLLGALEESERESVEKQLRRNPKLRWELAQVRKTLQPFWVSQPDYVPPSGLATRTCRWVALHSKMTAGPPPAAAARRLPKPVARLEPVAAAAVSPGWAGHSWSWPDLAVLAGILVVASLLVFPALQNSRFQARLAACQDNLRQIGLALTQYSEKHEGYFPSMPDRGSPNGVGDYAGMLLSDGFIDDSRRFLCPDSPLAEDHQCRASSFDGLLAQAGKDLDRLRRSLGRSYGYCMGYMEDGRYHSTRNLRRPFFALMADAPSLHLPGFQSVNHAGRGQNVLLEDGRVVFFTTPKPDACADAIFVNTTGFVAPGNHRDDSVIASGAWTPISLVHAGTGPR